MQRSTNQYRHTEKSPRLVELAPSLEFDISISITITRHVDCKRHVSAKQGRLRHVFHSFTTRTFIVIVLHNLSLTFLFEQRTTDPQSTGRALERCIRFEGFWPALKAFGPI